MKVRECVGCGYCCKQSMCMQGIMHTGKLLRECPLLVWSDTDQRYYCKEALVDAEFGERILVGAGCCSPLNTWRKEVKQRDYESL